MGKGKVLECEEIGDRTDGRMQPGRNTEMLRLNDFHLFLKKENVVE